MKIVFKDHKGATFDIAIIADNDLANATFIAIEKIKDYCKEQNLSIHYIRVWNSARKNRKITIFDIGSHTEFFYLDPALDINET